MAIFYFDTSALIKRYDAGEAGSAWVKSLFKDRASNLYLLSEISIVELHSALYRKSREGKITAAELQAMLSVLEMDIIQDYWLEPINRPILEMATDLIRRHPLRAYDAIQLANALRLNSQLKSQSNLTLLFLSKACPCQIQKWSPISKRKQDRLTASVARRHWARLIKRVYEVDPLICPKCSGRMRIISFIEDVAVIERMLRHLGLWHVPARKRAPPPTPAEITLDYRVADEPASYD